MDIYKTLLLFALVCALSAFFVMWAKWEEEKVKTREERDRRWDNISRAAGLENEIEQLKKKCETINDIARFQFERGVNLYEKNAKMQDRLSALLCPHNDHVWKDGICTKCGRSEQK